MARSVKQETWLRTNPRAHLLLVLPAVLLVGVGAVIVWFSAEPWGQAVGVVLGFVGALLMVVGWLSSYQPRLAFGDDRLFVHLRSGIPIGVPIEVVECFFLGQAPSMLRPDSEEDTTSTVVVRLAEAAADWKHFEVNTRLGRWCDGYITIRGTFCEPLSVDLLSSLNKRLAAAHRNKREKAGRSQ